MPLESLVLSVRPSPETRDFEVVVTVSGEPIHGKDMIGLDPDDLLGSDCRLLPGDTPHSAFVARCSCGILGCGSMAVTVAREGSSVVWTRSDDGDTRMARPHLRFGLDSYLAEVHRAIRDRSWETPERTTARMVSDAIDRDALADRGLEFQWASSESLAGLFTTAFLLYPGPYQILVHHERVGAVTPRRQADLILETLGQPPESWTKVEWLPQFQGKADGPAVAGPGWRRWQRPKVE